MAKYLFKGSYSATGAAGLMKEGGSAREKGLSELVAGMGGKVESFYYAFGTDDVVGVVDIPDVVTGVALSLAVNASGSVSVNITQLITPADMDAASQMVVNYRPPGA